MKTKYDEANDTLEEALIGQDTERYVEAKEMVNDLNVTNIIMVRKFVEPSNRVLGQSPKPLIMEEPK